MKNKEILISTESTIIHAIKKMNEIDCKLLLVTRNDKFHGLISIGDIQRAIIQNISLDTKIENILRKKIRVASPEDSYESIKQMMFKYRMVFCPVINENKEIVSVYFWEDVFHEQKPNPKSSFNIPVVIMAGGEGSRLKPLTNVFPKALIPIKEKTMLEEIFDRFSIYGCKHFYISVNYKAELIKYYINNLKLKLNIHFFEENKPLGTAGSLSLLKGVLKKTFFVSNCDILIEQDYSEILEYHTKNKNDITIIAALKHFPLSYGTVESSENGSLENLSEKPDLTFKINSGMYLLEPKTLEEIPENTFFHITELIDKIKNKGGKIGVFPVSENSWKDIGDWDKFSSFFIKQ